MSVLKPLVVVLAACVVCALPCASSDLILPGDLVYLGAFRLPGGSNGTDWEYSGDAMTYYPDGDPAGPEDGYPGSLFATGHTHQTYVSEITVPVPKISALKNLDELNVAGTLQPFANIRGNMFGDLEIHRVGLEYLPPKGAQTSGKLHFCWGQHFQDIDASHGWCETDLSHPASAGPWKLDGRSNYTTNDYIFEIPGNWADANTPGLDLATGRFREGVWSGGGPALFAYGPWNEGNPPVPNATLSAVTPLLLYGEQTPGESVIPTNESMRMNGYHYDDNWTGGAWLTSGNRSAVVFVGTKGLGKAWYGFANGVVWDYDCAEQNPPTCPDVPDAPYDNRGYWAEDYEARMIFYDPADLAAVAKGTKQTWEPQPYAFLTLDPWLFDATVNVTRDKTDFVGAMGFDRARGIVYVFENRGDGDKGLVHVWKLAVTSSGNAGNGVNDTPYPDDGNSPPDDTGPDNDNSPPDDSNGNGSDNVETPETENPPDTGSESEPTATSDTGGGGGCFVSVSGK